MKTKLISMQWRGCASVDPRFSAAMMPWTIADICSREQYSNLSIGIENGILETYNADFELQFSHQLKYIVGICKIATTQNAANNKSKLTEFITFPNRRPQSTVLDDVNQRAGYHGIVYLLKSPRDPLLHVFLFESPFLEEVNNLLHQLKDSPQPLGGSVGSIPSTFIDGRASSRSSDLHTLQKALRAHGIHSTPASNLKFSEFTRNAQHDGSPSIASTRKIQTSRSYSYDLRNQSDTNQNLALSTHSSASSSNTNLNMPDISPSSSQFFEVMYVGKIKVSHKRVPFTFIDDALPKFKAYDTQRIRSQTQKENGVNESDNQADPSNGSQNGDSTNDNNRRQSISSLVIVEECETNENAEQDDDDTSSKGSYEKVINTNYSENEKVDIQNDAKLRRKSLAPNKPDVSTTASSSVKQYEHGIDIQNDSEIIDEHKIDITPKQRDRSASIGSIPQGEQNRTMVLLVGKDDIRLISPDRKQVLLYKDMKDVASVSQGHKNSDHFGIIIRDSRNNTTTTNGTGHAYIGYVFKCQSDTIADDILTAISQSYISHSETKKNRTKTNQIFSCEHCPMLWYHKLCTDVDGLNDKKTQTLIFRRIEQLSEDEQDMIMAKYYGAEEIADHLLAEQNQFLMMLLRAHCESRQQRHIHDTAENRTEFLNQYLGGSTIFMKAKRSLTSSFDHLLKRRNSKDDVAIAQKEKPKEFKIPSSNGEQTLKKDMDEPDHRPTDLMESPVALKPVREDPKSPMMDIFMKVGNSPKEHSNNAGSWRQEMLQRVVTPSKNGAEANALLSPYRTPIRPKLPQIKRTKAEYQQLWKTAIRQTILLFRMERENERLQVRKDEHDRKMLKLDYDEIVPAEKQSVDRWDIFMNKEHNAAGVLTHKCDPKVMLQAIRGGVPRTKRGEVWTFLSDQFELSTAPIDTSQFPNYNTPYNELLKCLCEHQHAIFIDLGRTFPNHPYYKDSLGIGQLSLFNVLKAYSILDPELGYCQGLGFICGVLLLHCEEEEAFELLKHLMFRRKMRANYLPDMKQFQLQLYQLSRLIRDKLPDLYRWLDENDVSPTLYAAPWILTVFSSQFPLGFVTRIFDLLFLESSEVVFRVAIKLLEIHQIELMKRDNFEDIMNYMKGPIPDIDASTMEKIMRDAFTMDVKKQMAEYQVEYNVLQEEICTAQHYMESLNREKENYTQLETKYQLAELNITKLEKSRTGQQKEIQALQLQVQSLETTVDTLGQFMLQMLDQKIDIDIPGDVQRLLQQIGHLDRPRKKPVFVDRRIGKSMSVSANLGFPLKTLDEIEPNEYTKQKSTSFDNTHMQLRRQSVRSRPNVIETINSEEQTDENCPPIRSNKPIIDTSNAMAQVSIKMARNNDGFDSGIATPITPKEHSITSIVETIQHGKNAIESIADLPHPFGNCEDINFKFSGTTQLKTLRPLHLRSTIPPTSMATNDKHIDGRN